VTIHLAPGRYNEEVVTRVNGTATRPITIEGDDTGFVATARQRTVLMGVGRIFSVNNSYYHLQGFSIEGEPTIPTTSYPTDLGVANAFKDRMAAKVVDSTMIFVGASDTVSGVHGIVVDDMFLSGAGGDCIRLRNDASHNTISNSTIQWCGMLAKASATAAYVYHNGEGVYIGTSPKSTDQPDYADDASHDNLVQGNVIHTYGSECLDVKENATRTIFIDNDCADNSEPLSDYGSNIELRSYNNSIVHNRISGSAGYGLKLASDGPQYRQGGNIVKGNVFSADAGASIVNKQTTAQGAVCGNILSVPAAGTWLASPARVCAGS
jgi:hypothetical protein